jgi:hypothetical protein
MTDTPDTTPDKPEFTLPNPRGDGKRVGRKTLLTDDKLETIVDLLRRGNYLSSAAKYAGLSPYTLNEWKNKGRALMDSEKELDDTEQLYVRFYQEVEKARAEAEIRAVEVIRSAMPNNWQAAAWYLERTNNPEWGRTVKTEVSGPDGGAIPIDVDSVYRKLEAVTQRVVLDVEAVEATLAPELPQKATGGHLEADAVVVDAEPTPEGK